MSLLRHRIPIYALSSRSKSTVPSSSSYLKNPEPQSSSPPKINVPFSHPQTGPFVQPQFRHSNAYLSDGFLRRNLERLLPPSVFRDVQPDLVRFGERVSTDIWKLSRECEENPPFLRQSDAWGNRIDEIVTCPAWKEQKNVSAQEGLIALAYERSHEEFSRLHQVVKLSLFGPASGLYGCPLAMTDGAAKTIESNEIASLQEPFRHLTSRDPHQFWTSGQWMTEKAGGSDVGSGTETLAMQDPDRPDKYRLYGYKWFSSATDSDMSLTLARVVDSAGQVVKGSRGISMFYVKMRREDGSLNGIQVQKLKNKLGTRQLPTGELLLDGTEAQLISSEGRGIPSITNMLTVTRMHNIITSVAGPRKMLSLSRDYARRRKAFGKSLDEHILHMQTLCRLETETRGCAVLMLDLARQLGLDDCGKIADQDKLLLRLFMPVAKMYTAKSTMASLSEGLESFGGQGYIEDTGLPTLFRDGQVLPIWEGTSNVMSLDVLRSIAKSNGEVLVAFNSRVSGIVKAGKSSSNPVFQSAAEQLSAALGGTVKFVQGNSQILEIAGRDLTVSLAHVYIGSLLLEHAMSEAGDKTDLFTVKQWLETRTLAPVVLNDKNGVYQDDLVTYRDMVYDGYDENQLL